MNEEKFQDKSSGLEFTFDENWSDLIQFDEDPDVKKFAEGLSSLDFLGVLSKNKIVMIEAKNFKNRPADQQDSIIQKLGSKNDSPLIRTIVENIKDALLFILYKSKKAETSDGLFWEELRKHLFGSTMKIYCVLWFETPFEFEGKSKGWMYVHKAVMEDMLKEKLRFLTSKQRIMIVNQLHNPFDPHLQVSFLKK